MRITNTMLVNNMMNNIGRNLNRMSRYQDQMATGKKISVPSDDPIVASRALKLRTDVAEIDQYQRNAKDAQSWLDITEATLANVGDILQRARELSVQAANGTTTPDDMTKISAEIEQLSTQISQLGNTSYAGRYIFSGFNTDKPVVDENTGDFALNVSNNESIVFEIGVGDDMNINVTGGDLFNRGAPAYSANGIVTGTDITSDAGTITTGVNDRLAVSIDGAPAITAVIPAGTYETAEKLADAVEKSINDAFGSKAVRVLSAGNKLQFTRLSEDTSAALSFDPASGAAQDLGLVAPTIGKGTLMQVFDNFTEALQSGNKDGISKSLNDIDKEIDNVLRVRADIGARQNRLDLTTNRLENDNVTFTRLMSENEDVDMAQTIMNLTSEQNVYRASLAGGAKIIQTSLVDFLR